MPQLTSVCPRGGGGDGPGQDRTCGWMETRMEDGEREKTPGTAQCRSWSRGLRVSIPWRAWFTIATVGVVWSVCQLEAPVRPSVSPVDVGWMFVLVCTLWMLLGGCVFALKRYLQLGERQVEPHQKIQEEPLMRRSTERYQWTSRPRTSALRVPLALALTDSLLVCVLQEPLPDPSVAHIQALLSRLESVSHTLEQADTASEAREDELRNKVKVLSSYLRQRTKSLRRLVHAQEDLEAGMKDMLEGLGGLWAELEELHTRVTLTKEGVRGHRDLASAQTEAETVCADLGRYRKRLHGCQAHLKDCTQLLQELTWSRAHISHSVSSSSSTESVWPERLLQSNIEQFDKVQERFLSLEQQTCTFQAHLEGLGGEGDEGHAGPLSPSASPLTSPRLLNGRSSDASLEPSDSSPASTSVSSLDGDAETDTALARCKRSAMQLSSALGNLRRSGRRKK
ncbi:uncharacterized protein LOC142995036 [Genypterus blacodes]|uniref:uncharacterized protein LOC142995036 n=1 Tax=Genypterus blacodes TaxID=154954 RepID=UPI003F7736D6